MDPTLIITRPAPAGPGFAAAVLAMLDSPVAVIHAPAFRITPLAAKVPQVAHVIFTSVNGVAAAPAMPGAMAWCVGQATGRAARARGFESCVAGGDAEALIALILSERPQGRMVHLAGRHRRGAVAERLTAAGVPCDTVEVYAQIAEPPTAALIAIAKGTSPLVAPVFSPRSAQGLLAVRPTAPLHVIAISPAVAEVMAELMPATLLTAIKPYAHQMENMTAKVIQRLR